MEKMTRTSRFMVCLSITAVFFLLFTGCTWNKSDRRTTTSRSAIQKKKEPVPLYLDFGDVLIPGELKMDKKSSLVIQSPGFSTGLIVLKGRVNVKSLIDFFENNMAKDNWKLACSLKSPRSVMVFEKENRRCVINILEKEFNMTYVEIWVAPTIDETTSSGLLN